MASRAFAAAIAGLLAAIAMTGLVSWLPPGPWSGAIVPAIIAFVPLWIGFAALAFVPRTAARAWMLLVGIAGMGFGLLTALRASGLVL